MVEFLWWVVGVCMIVGGVLGLIITTPPEPVKPFRTRAEINREIKKW